MNLVCFANHTAGGLLCDLLNDTRSQIDAPILYKNIEHHVFTFKNNARVCRYFDEATWTQREKRIIDSSKDIWYGTHIHPSSIPESYFNKFNKVIAITTVTKRSKFYRFLRCYYLNDMAFTVNSIINSPKKDPEQIAELIKETFEPDHRCINIEFEDIVDGKYVSENNLNMDQLNIWKNHNNFLFSNIDPTLVEVFNKVIT